ncbi:conserved hypothetical protein [Neospora caninum Liverpool]|uniref:Uncharacterized protein n=1 Tax=Neospora caninum (strain Liverpool) TaxID=572307 RepID=F0V9A8_NEOCL|nr:conserved hypothetical protein [Neospora caninum Liverpool]CBZ50333.1 conserved hypothetical protein [Neospora caninum Liverpool]CEL64939.1 TPA: hypothetical protein BN1204_008060 [Neospora caninum Liverpool]|eukprot:XP_003880367.1 conserved hypothetical protein [Neospora caninum Liverpool]
MHSHFEMIGLSDLGKQALRKLLWLVAVVVSLEFLVNSISCATEASSPELGGVRISGHVNEENPSLLLGGQAPQIGRVRDFDSTGCASAPCEWPVVGASSLEPQSELRKLGASHMLEKAIETAGVAASDLLRPHLGALAAGVNTYFPQAVASLTPLPPSGSSRQDDSSHYASQRAPPPQARGGRGELVPFSQAAVALSHPTGLHHDVVADLARHPAFLFTSSTTSVRDSIAGSAPALTRVSVLRDTLSAAGSVLPRPRSSNGRVDLDHGVSGSEQDGLPGSYTPQSKQETDDRIFTKVDMQLPASPGSLSTDSLAAVQQHDASTGVVPHPVGFVLKPRPPVADDKWAAVSERKWVEDKNVNTVREETMKRLRQEIDETAKKRKASLEVRTNESGNRVAEGLLPLLFNPDVANAAAAGVMVECKNPVFSVPLGGFVTLDLRGLDNDIYQLFLSGVMSGKQDIELDVWNSAGIYYEQETRFECRELGTSKMKFFIAGKPTYNLVPKVIFFCSATVVCTTNPAWKAPFHKHMLVEH